MGGVADEHGGLKTGDQILSVNDISMENTEHEIVAELLKGAKGNVRLIVKTTPR